MQIINGQQMALRITQKIARDIFDNSLDNRPGLAIILAGERNDSQLYVDIKQQRAKEVGIDTHLYKIENSETTKDIIRLIEHLNQDEEVDGILVQLPLPEKYDTDKIIASINPDKDVDCFHPENVKNLENYRQKKPKIISPVYGAVLEILKEVYFEFQDSENVVLVNSELFGQGLKNILESYGSKTEVVFSEDENLENKIKKADLLITALGKKYFIKGEMIKPNAVVIDIGITKEDEGVYGDIDFEDVKEMTRAITPVPGGVGPLTVAKVLENTWTLSKERLIAESRDCKTEVR